MMPVSSIRTVLILACLLGLAACLTSAPPKLSAEDLRTQDGFAGRYLATTFPDEGKEATATVSTAADRSYTMQIVEGDHADSPVHVRFLDLSAGRLLAVLTEDATVDAAMYALVTHASSGAWVFRSVDLKPDHRNRALQEVIARHGGGTVSFDNSDVAHDEIPGTFSAANLRALFADPDFLQAIDTGHGFRLSRAE